MKLNEKGKYFTDRVSKRQVQVVITTIHGHMRGHVFVLPTQRVKDLLNNDGEQFLAVTDVTSASGEGQSEHIPFIAINKRHIVTVIPIDEEASNPHNEKEDGYYPY